VSFTYIEGQDLAETLGLDAEYALDPDPFDQVAGAVDDLLNQLLDEPLVGADAYAQKEAGLGIAVDVYQARTAAGGESVALDFTPGPYRVSSALIKRYSALLAPYMKVTGMVG
jgi:hypothetical protein